MKKEKLHKILQKYLQIIVLFTVIFTVFSFTVIIRRPWFGDLSAGHHQWLTGSTVVFTRNWFEEGIVKKNFAMFENPNSVEFSTLKDQDYYVSYPPGTIIPIYAISLVTNQTPNPSMVMSYNLLNHFLIALCAAFTVYIILRKLVKNNAITFFLPLIASLVVLLSQGPFYYFQNVYFSDQAIILPFAVFILLETIRDFLDISPKTIKLVKTMQFFISIYGVLTDWFFISILLITFIKRNLLFRKNLNLWQLLKKAGKFFLIPLIISGTFVINLLANGEIGKLISRFNIRTNAGSDPTHTNIFQDYWNFNVSLNFSFLGVVIIAASIIALIIVFFYLLKKPKKLSKNIYKIYATCFLAYFSCIVHTFLLINHSLVHTFAALKLVVPLAVVSFTLLPFLIFLVFKETKTEKFQLLKKVNLPSLTLIISLVAGIYLIFTFIRFPRLFPDTDPRFIGIATFINKATSYNDIVFSPEYEIPIEPPQALAYSNKRVYQVATVSEINQIIKPVQENYYVNLVVNKNIPLPSEFVKIVNAPETVLKDSYFNWRLYKINKIDYWKYFSK